MLASLGIWNIALVKHTNSPPPDETDRSEAAAGTYKRVLVIKQAIHKTPDRGRLAQGLERCVDIAEATGSNPVSPTMTDWLVPFGFLQ